VNSDFHGGWSFSLPLRRLQWFDVVFEWISGTEGSPSSDGGIDPRRRASGGDEPVAHKSFDLFAPRKSSGLRQAIEKGGQGDVVNDLRRHVGREVLAHRRNIGVRNLLRRFGEPASQTNDA